MSSSVKHRILNLFVSSLIVFGFLGIISVSVAHADELYGDNIYGECPYGQACPDSGGSPPPTPTSTSSPAPTSTPTTNSASPSPEPTSTPGTGGQTEDERDSNTVPGGGSASPSPPGSGSVQRDFRSLLEKNRIGRFLIENPITVPVIFFILLLVMALILAVQAGLEHRSVIRLRQALVKLNELQIDVRNFLLVFQHNLRAPLTGCLAALSMLSDKKIAHANTAYELAQLLNDDVNKVVDETVADLELVSVDSLSKGASSVKLLQTVRLPSFWGPVVTVVTLTGLYYVLTWQVLDIAFSTQLVVLQLAVLFAGVVVVFASVALRRRTRQRKQLLELASTQARQFAEKRSVVVSRLNKEVQEKYSLVSRAVEKLPEDHEALLVHSTIHQLGRILQKLALVEELQAPDYLAHISAETYELPTEIERVVEAVRHSTLTKNLIQVDVSHLQVKNLQGAVGLVNFVLAAAVDNAVKYAREGSAVNIRAATVGDRAVITIENRARDSEVIDMQTIFTPFTRYGVGLTSDVQGSGMSLYTASIIMRRLGGNIKLQTDKPDSVRCVIDLPLKINPQG